MLLGNSLYITDSEQFGKETRFWKRVEENFLDSCEVLQLQHTLDNLSQYSEFLFPRRKCRATLDIVWNIPHDLYGVLDSNNTEQMAENKANVNKN